jgi:hypothetical protein
MQKNVDLRHVRTGVRLTREEIVESQLEALGARTRRRQRAAKEALRRAGVEPRVRIGSGYVPPRVARQFLHCAIGGSK